MRVYNIASSQPFMPCFVQSLIRGQIDVGLQPPFATGLVKLTVYVPTKRAEKALLACLHDALDGCFLAPEIITLGGIDAPQDTAILGAYQFDEEKRPTPIGNTQRLIYLTRLVHAFLDQQSPKDAPDPSMAESMVMAQQLAQLLDSFAYEQVPLEQLVDVVPEQFAQNWSQSLEFLNVIFKHWPDIKQEANMVDRVEWDNENLSLCAHYWRHEKSDCRAVIALGSTGSRPATAQLLKVIASHRAGAVILPGLDRIMHESAFVKLAGVMDHKPQNTFDSVPFGLQQAHAHAHPQYRLAQLLKTLGLTRDKVIDLKHVKSKDLDRRVALLSEAMVPIDETVHWAQKRSTLDEAAVQEAFEYVTLVKAGKDATQAQAIALILRESLQLNKTVAVVTPDRMLARRVAAELKIWNIDIDDSAGLPLSETRGARLLGLLVALWQSDWGKTELVALLSHPDVLLNHSRSETGRFLRHIYHKTLRHILIKASPINLKKALEQDDKDAVQHEVFKMLIEALTPLQLASDEMKMGLKDWAQKLKIGFQILKKGDEEAVYPGDDELIALLQALIEADGAEMVLGLDQLGGVIKQTMAMINVRKPGKAAHNIAILGPLEARLQHFDRLVLAGLSEHIWPRPTQTSAWASRGMLAQMGCEPPERVIGLSAHDFATSFGAKELFITHSDNDGSQPSLPSRWLQRLEAFLGEANYRQMVTRGEKYLKLADELRTYQAQQNGFGSQLVPRPMPTPPVAARPKHLSVTKIKVLRQDPYAVYAAQVLKLHPLDPLDPPLDAALSGTIVHSLMAQLVRENIFTKDQASQIDLITHALNTYFETHALPGYMRALWCEWLARQLQAYLDWEKSRAPAITARHAEVEGQLWFKGALEGLSLKGRADRLDEDSAGGVHVLDFKTGQVPNSKAVLRFDEPQLLLEALMVREGAFKILGRRLPTQPTYIPLKFAPKLYPIKPILDEKDDLNKPLDELYEQLQSLIEAFCLKDDTAFVSHLIPQSQTPNFVPPYDHLARVKEWRRHQGIM